MQKNAIAFVEYSYNKYSIAVLAGVLEEDQRFHNLDIHFLKSGQLDLAIHQIAEQYDKLVVGFSFHTPNVIQVGELIGGIRQAIRLHGLKHVLLIAGGPHPSGDPLGTLELGVDVVVVGEGEVALPSLLERYYHEQDYCDIKGLAFFDSDGTYRYTGRNDPIDLSDYAAFAPKHRRFSPIEISRGCPWACKFCQTPFLMGGRMRHRSIESIVKYAQVAKQHGLRDLRFITPVSFAYGSPDGRTVDLAQLEAMLKAVTGIFGKEHVYLGSFPSEVRPETVTPETIGLIKKYCANDNLVIGAQSGSMPLLKAMHRGHGVEEVIRATELIIEAGLVANIDFIFGMPGETRHDIEDTISLMHQLVEMGARVHSHTFMPLVGTPFSSARPGIVDKRTRQLLKRLRGQGLEYGDWEKQERIASETSSFLSRQKEDRPQSLQEIHPLRPR